MEAATDDARREPRVPLAGDLLSETREVMRAALALADHGPDADQRMLYRAVYARELLGRGDGIGRPDAFRLVSEADLEVLAACGELVLTAGGAHDAALVRKARRVVELAGGEPA